MENLEPRLLFSAAPVEAPVEEADSGNAEPQAAEESSVPAENSDQQGQAAGQTGSAQTETAPAPSGDTEVGVEQTVNLVELDDSSAALNQETLEAIAEAAAERWRATGLTAEQSAALDAIDYEIADLSALHAATFDGGTVTVDLNANTRTWFIDSTPFDDSEFTMTGMIGGAVDGAAAAGVDLLTVILHEQGHALGVRDVHGSENSNSGVMHGIMDMATRRLPAPGEAVGANPGSFAGPANASFSPNVFTDDAIDPGNDATSFTLREAIIAANTDVGAANDVIQLSAGTYLLTIGGFDENASATGDLDILDNGTLTIQGSTTGSTIIDAGGDTGLGDRVIHIVDGATAFIDSVTVQGGRSGDAFSTGLADGGGIRVQDATATVSNSTIRDNVSDDGFGFGGGGGIAVTGFNNPVFAELTLLNSTITGNQAEFGGGLSFQFGGRGSVINSTIAGNTSGTGINHTGGLESSNNVGVPTIFVRNSIIADNTGTYPDFHPHPGQSDFTVTNTLIESATGHTVPDSATSGDGLGNIVGTDPMLGALANNGGPTFTHELQAGSVAIDAGADADATAAGLTTDQRGTGFARILGTAVDMGAFEAVAVASNTDPTQNANIGLTVNEGSTANTIGQVALEFTDTEEGASDVTFTLDTVPANGTLHISGGAALTAGATFTQAQINSNVLTYNHDGSETTSDSIQFDVTDGQGGATNDATFAFTITPQNDAPAILTNSGLTVLEGASGTIGNAQLNENDPDDSGTGLTYTVTALPGNGSVKKNGTALVLNGTFTQDDIDNSLVTYEHNGTATTSDSFDFSLADGGENGSTAATGTFSITVTPAAPAGDNSASVSGGDLTVNADGDGDTVTISSDGTNLKIHTPDDSIIGGSGTTTDTFGDVIVPLAGLTSITIDAGGDNDIINVNSLDGFTGTLDIDGGDGQDTINFKADVVLDPGNNANLSGQEVDFWPNSSIETQGAGSIIVNGTGGGSGSFEGISLNNADLTASGTGTISLTGEGGDDGSNNKGVQIVGGSMVTTSDGDITIDGTGGGTGVFNSGVVTLSGASISAGGNGNLTITGSTTPNGTVFNDGVLIASGTSASVHNGNMVITGTGNGSSVANRGVNLNGNNVIATLQGTGTGNITVTGSSNGSLSGNVGIQTSSAVIDTTAGTGSVTLNGMGSTNGSSTNVGVKLVNGRITTGGDGAIDIDGVGGGSATAGTTNNRGVSLETGIDLTVAGTGTIDIDGTAGNGTYFNDGVRILTGSEVTSVNGAILIRGTAGGTLGQNRGIQLAGVVKSTGSGAVTLAGTGSQSATSSLNQGVYVSGGTVSANTGDLTISGVGGTGTSGNAGVYILNSTVDGGAGSLIRGTGGGSTTTNYGVYMQGITGTLVPGNVSLLSAAGGTTAEDLFGNFLS